jgi:putative ATPase
MRPETLEEVLGQDQLLGPASFLRRAIEKDRLPSLIFWGPPGVGKTTLATVIARTTKREFVSFSAVLGGVVELRAILKKAEEDRNYRARATILFVDEIHRFNKAQQDAFLPYVENGTITLIGATTENPSFAVNAAVLSRSKVLRLDAIGDDGLMSLLRRALLDVRRGLGETKLALSDDALLAIARAARGDARRALNLLETITSVFAERDSSRSDEPLGLTEVSEILGDTSLLYDKQGEEHYNLASAFIKSMRGSDPDASLYYMMRMLEAGEEPLFLLRRLMIFASEDIGNAEPRALSVATAADEAFRRMGMPEGIYPLSHACLFLASCPKSGAVTRAIAKARALIHEHGALPVPKKLRNAPTKLMSSEGYGAGYRYAHDFAEGFAPGEVYLPDAIAGERLYEPTEHGLEKAIKERLERIAERRRKPE